MAIYSFYVFNRHCECIFYQNWTLSAAGLAIPANSAAASGTGQNQSLDASAVSSNGGPGTGAQTAVSNNAATTATTAAVPWEEQAKLVYGVLFSLANMINKLATRQPNDGFHSYRTNSYRLFAYTTASNMRFVVLTSPDVDDTMRDHLQQIYAQLWVELVAKNALWRGTKESLMGGGTAGLHQHHQLFRVKLNQYMRSLKYF